MENIAIRQVSPNSAKKSIIRAFKKQRPIFIWGPPGIGKSDIVSQITDTFEQSHLIDVRLSLWEPTDVKGMPYYSANDNTMKWAPPVELPDENLKKNNNFIDENEEDFEFNQDIEFDEPIRSPGWIRYQKKLNDK